MQQSWGDPIAKIRNLTRAQTVRVGELRTVLNRNPLAIAVQTTHGVTFKGSASTARLEPFHSTPAVPRCSAWAKAAAVRRRGRPPHA